MFALTLACFVISINDIIQYKIKMWIIDMFFSVLEKIIVS